MIQLFGDLDISVSQALEKIDTMHNYKEMTFDLDDVHYCNTDGGNAWVNFITSFPDDCDIVFIKCRPTFIDFTNVVPEFLGKGAIESFYTPYVCQECRNQEQVLAAVAMIRDSQGFPSAACNKCGADGVPDVGDSYLKFLEAGER